MDKVWLKEALTCGNSGNGFKLGTVLTLGWFWTRRSGCRLLYRGRNLEQINFGEILAVSNAEAKQIKVPRWISHEAGSTYYYIVRQVDRFGRQEETYRAMVKIAIDSDGKPAGGRCNNIKAVTGRQEAGERIGLKWYYHPIGQGAEPYCFKIYSDQGTGRMGLESPAGTVNYCGPGFYSCQVTDCPAGKNLFVIKTADREGQENVCWARTQVGFSESKPNGIEISSIKAQ